MKRLTGIVVVLVGVVLIVGCGSSGGSETGSSSALPYADFGKTVSDAIPDGLKDGGVSANLAILEKALSGDCFDSYTGCPYFSEEGGGDTQAGEIIMRLWAMDYNDECQISANESICFQCPDCGSDDGGTWYLMPTMFSASDDAAVCEDQSAASSRSVNFGIDPCVFDSMIARIDNIAECETVEGGAVDISSVMPWYASWGVPEEINFSSYSVLTEGGMYWTVNDGVAGNERYFFSISSDWIYAGRRDAQDDEFLFFGTGSPSYYEENGEDSGINIAAYAGSLSAIPAEFEAMQIRDQGSETYIERMKSKVADDGTYVWYQTWRDDDMIPMTPDQVDSRKNSPSDNRCVAVGASLAASRYVPLSDCVTAFGVADTDALNQDSNFILKMIDIETAGSISFDNALTPATTSTCLEE